MKHFWELGSGSGRSSTSAANAVDSLLNGRDDRVPQQDEANIQRSGVKKRGVPSLQQVKTESFVRPAGKK